MIGVNLGGHGGQVGGDGEGGAGAGHPPDGWKPLLQVLKAFICLDYDDLPKQVNFKISLLKFIQTIRVQAALVSF